MDEDVVGVMESAGLCRNEAVVYLALLEQGMSTATRVAKRSNLHRTNVYDSIERLIKKGFASYVTVDEKRYFMASDPENFMGLLREREDSFRQILPRLRLSRDLSGSGKKVRVFESVRGIRVIMDDIINSVPEKGCVYAIGDLDGFPASCGVSLDLFHKRRRDKEIGLKQICGNNAQKKCWSNVFTAVYADKVAFVIASGPVFGILIENKGIAGAYRCFIESLTNSVM